MTYVRAEEDWQDSPDTSTLVTATALDTIEAGIEEAHDLLALVTVPANLTSNGYAITDATRTAAVEGDGRIPESSFGCWRDSTNRLTNGGFETNTTGWSTAGTNTLARVAGGKFGSYAAEVTYQNSLTLLTASITGVTAAFKHWATAWVYVPTAWDGGQIQITTPNFAGGAEANATNANMALTDQWQRIRVMQTPVSGDMAGDFTVIAASAPTAGRTIKVDGCQWERTNGVATPYLHTDGATATRVGALITFPSSWGLVNPTQGWCAVRWRTGFSSAVEAAGSNRLFCWYDSDNERLEMFYQITDNRICVRRKGGGLGNEAYVDSNLAFEQTLFMLGSWTATNLGMSVDGAAFANFANTSIPALTAPNILIAAANNIASTVSLGEIFWLAFGNGTLTNTDAATMYAYGDDPPAPNSIPGNCTLLWTADTTLIDRRLL